ncbi:MFS transporter [Gorillibacterium sp. CAU 1737]|uniref:MFS transporter n=1 Tax=Gorillibacterium sp. CAU 1737 TaxID=3140362 RepID=UPI0032613D5D
MNAREISWTLYDVGNSAFILLVSTIIPLYFKSLAGDAELSLSDSTAYWGYTLSISTLVVAVLGPILGTLADTNGYKKPLFLSFLLLGGIGCAAMALPVGWLTFLIIFTIARIGFSGSLIFYDSMLNDITTDERMDHVSSQGYAWGYLGSCVPFLLSLGFILNAEKLGTTTTAATMTAFGVTAVWWLAFSIPLLRGYRQICYVDVPNRPIAHTFRRIADAGREMKRNPKIFWFLLAFFFYIDGVYTIIEMATVYGKDVGITDNAMLLALLLTQVVAFPFALLFGRLAGRMKAGNLILLCILGYLAISLFALQLDQAWEFWLLAVCVAVFQGAIQALSRSYFAKLIPKEKSSEYFGFFDIFGKGAAFLGTAVMGLSSQLSGSSRTGVAVIVVMFAVGFILFRKAERMETNNTLH